MKKAVYPGSFDPLTNGHLDLIKRASKLVDELHILVADNIHKSSSFSIKERLEMIKLCTLDIPNLVLGSSNDLVVNYCKENGIKIIVRGLRNYQDYESEFTLFQYNRDIYPEIETILLCPTTKNQVVSSRAIKELVNYNECIGKYVPPQIKAIITEKLKK